MRRAFIPDETAYDQQRAEPSCAFYQRKNRDSVLLMRTKTVKAGEWLECDIYPVLDRDYSRTAKRRKTAESIRAQNLRRARKRLEWLLNANFDRRDMLAHFTCAFACPEEEFRRITHNFMDRLRRSYRARGRELKYIYVIETTGKEEKMRHHIHMALNGGVLSRDEVEKIWRHGLARADRVQEMDTGLRGFALYITQHKDAQEKLMSRKWACSKGLKQPAVTESSSRFSRTAAGRIEKAVREDAEQEFKKRYPGYKLIEYQVKYSDFLPGVYITAFMRKIQ